MQAFYNSKRVQENHLEKELLKQFSDSTDCAMVPEEDTVDRSQICDTKDVEGWKTSPAKSGRKRSRWTWTRRKCVKRGRPLTAFANNEEALSKKRSCIVIRNKYNIASAIITAIQHSRFKLNLRNRYQQCRYVPIIFSEK